MTALAKKYGITTPYTSYLIVPDAAVPVAQRQGAGRQAERAIVRRRAAAAPALAGGLAPRPAQGRQAACRWRSSPSGTRQKPGDLEANRGAYADKELAKGGDERARTTKARREAKDKKEAYDAGPRASCTPSDQEAVQAGKLGVDLSVQTANLRNQTRLEQTASRTSTAATAWNSAASGSTKASTPRCRP